MVGDDSSKALQVSMYVCKYACMYVVRTYVRTFVCIVCVYMWKVLVSAYLTVDDLSKR